MKSIIYTAAIALVLFSCSQTQDPIINNSEEISVTKVSVIEPIDGVNEGAKSYTVNADRADTILLESGGSIIFDDNTFVDANGKPIKGDVDVEWQEFHSLGDIMASGIPMKYDSAGVDFDLVSGGMFTIDATQNGKDVEIAKGKSATVNLASVEDTPCYNFYSMDESTGQWDYETTKNGEKVEEEDVAEVVEASPYTIIEATLNTKNFPELKDTDIIGWKANKKLSSGEEQFVQSPQTQIRLADRNDDGTYVLEARDKKKTKLVTITAAPYSMEEALADSELNKEELQLEIDQIAEYQANEAKGKIIRSIEIPGFGTYNWDIVCMRENSRKVIAEFDYPGGVNPKLVSLSLLSPDENAVVKYNASGDEKFSFDPNKRNCLIGILPNNEIVTVSNKGFNKARRAKDGSKVTFKFKKTGIKISSPQDIMTHMNKLI